MHPLFDIKHGGCKALITRMADSGSFMIDERS